MKAIKTLAIFVAAWLILTVIGYLIGHAIFDPSKHLELEENGSAVHGKVIKLEPENHQLVHYSYRVGEAEFQGTGTAGGYNPGFAELNVGDQVIVVYIENSPEKSMLGYPSYDRSVNEQAVVATAVVFPIFPMLSIVGFYLMIRALRRDKATLE
ncbi:MAG TPA: DUF3592 domain-containing protein [Pyrinomonadaceae bacterium]|nr:DUF3592 domain-containing protein [Pyrinomonadaceae bacterium]HMP64735.1 DUF3592 domain-containing protein [Pyrinomonadaceae bacterium]